MLHSRGRPFLLQEGEDPPDELTEEELTDVDEDVHVLLVQELVQQEHGSETCHLDGENTKDHMPE